MPVDRGIIQLIGKSYNDKQKEELAKLFKSYNEWVKVTISCKVRGQ